MSGQRKVVVSEAPDDLKEALLDLDLDLDVEAVSLDIVDEVDDDVADEEFSDSESDDERSVEDLDDNEPIWLGGPLAGDIKRWKQEFGDIYVTSITYDKHIVWRVLNRIEYKQIVKKMEQLVQAGQLSSAEANMWNEETIAEMCILYPKYNKKDLSGIMAGMPSLIAQEVLEASGFVALEVRQL